MRRGLQRVAALLLLAACVGPTGDPSSPDPVGGAVGATVPAPTASAPVATGLDGDGGSADAASDGAADCNVRIGAPTVLPATHVPVGSLVTYDSNPPSSGPHYPIWANFEEYATPVPDGYLVHAMEHGAVVLFYKCDGAGSNCAEIVAFLRSVRDALPDDPLCTSDIRVRVIIVPRPEDEDLIAAAAWGFTYRASCPDPASLSDFVRTHYAKGPEDFCSPGTDTF